MWKTTIPVHYHHCAQTHDMNTHLSVFTVFASMVSVFAFIVELIFATAASSIISTWALLITLLIFCSYQNQIEMLFENELKNTWDWHIKFIKQNDMKQVRDEWETHTWQNDISFKYLVDDSHHGCDLSLQISFDGTCH